MKQPLILEGSFDTIAGDGLWHGPSCPPSDSTYMPHDTNRKRGGGPVFHPRNARISHMLNGKNAIVTGSTSGIGLVIAQALAERGCNILFNGLGDTSEF